MDALFEIYNLSDDGVIPNSKYPVIVYHGVLDATGEAAADFLQSKFEKNGWSNSFRWRVYNYHHYHTNTHEVLGVYAGNALLLNRRMKLRGEGDCFCTGQLSLFETLRHEWQAFPGEYQLMTVVPRYMLSLILFLSSAIMDI